MSGFSNYLVTKTGYLVRTFIRSFNYVAGVSGWTINKDGSAEFNNVTIRGGEIVGGTSLYYSGTPAAGNLIGSESGSPGTDKFGNAYLAGTVTYFLGTLALQILEASITLYTAPDYAGPWTVGNTSMVLDDVVASITAPNITLQGPLTIPLVIGEPGSIATPETWHTATLVNGWTGTAEYMATPDGTVMLRTLGSLNAGTITSGTTLFTLPSGYLPNVGQVIPCIISAVGAGSAATGDVPYLSIGSTGAVDVFNISVQVATNIRFAGAYSLT